MGLADPERAIEVQAGLAARREPAGEQAGGLAGEGAHQGHSLGLAGDGAIELVGGEGRGAEPRRRHELLRAGRRYLRH